jgi:hypothetical protein
VREDGPVSVSPDKQSNLSLARDRARLSLPVSLLVLLAIIAMTMPLPKRFVAVLPLLVALPLTIRLLRFLAGRPGRERFWPILTLVVIGMLLSQLTLQAVFFTRVRAYEQCLANAQTGVARGACEELRREAPPGSQLILDAAQI